jgi:hypothetical protein
MKTTTARIPTRASGPEGPLFTELRHDRLLSAFRACTPTEQTQVIRLAETLALARSRRLAWQAAKRGTGIRNRMQWMGGAR